MAARDGFDRRTYRPPAATGDYVFAFAAPPALARGAECAVRIECEAYLDATGSTCPDHWLEATLAHLPTYMREVEPGLFASTASRTFTALLLGGLGMRESERLAQVATPGRDRKGAARDDAFVDPVDRYLDQRTRFATDGDARRTPPAERTATAALAARDYLFCVMPDPEREEGEVPMVLVHLVPREFFERHGTMEYEGVDLPGLPGHLEELAEAQYHSARPIGQVCMDLEALGMTASRELETHVKETLDMPSPGPGR